MNLDKEREQLSQAETLKDLQRDLEPAAMIPVFRRPNPGSQELYLSNALIPADKLKSPLSDNDWNSDLDLTGLPITEWDEEGTRYLIHGVTKLDERVKRLIIQREFARRKENFLEICEEFRLFNNLYHAQETNKYLKENRVDGGYEEVVVAVVEPNCVKMLGKEIRHFLKHKQMYLALRLTCRAYSEYSVEELGLRQDQVESEKMELSDGHLSWRCTYREARRDGYRTESTLHATRLIGFSEVGKEKPVEFIVDVDENGHKTTLSWDKGLDAWVHFRKQVLDKYYREPAKYTVEDTFLVCHGSNGAAQWILLIDDDHDDKVCAKLSDFALIPYEEQKHWGEHDIPPEGNISETYLKRYGDKSLRCARISHRHAPRVSSTRPEHLFRQRYNELQAVCNRYLGWQLVRPFGTVTSANQYIVLGTPLIIRYSGPDEHHLRCLRVPFSDNQSDFDEMVRSLVLVLIDSLNVDKLKNFFPLDQQNKFRSEHTIAWLGAALNHLGVEGPKDHICFLKQLQNLRSSGVGHRKDSDPQMYADSVEYFNLAKLGLQKGFAEILRQAIEVLEFFVRIVQRGELSGKTEVPLLYDLNERLGELSKTLFPSEAEDISTDETWMRETVPGIEHLVIHLMTKVVPKFDGSASELMNICEPPITSLNPDATTADIRIAITYIAKGFIQAAPSSLQAATSILARAEGTNMPTTEVFEKTASCVAYAKKLADFSLGFVNHDEMADSAWYRHYVAHLLSYVSCYTAYTYTHVLRADGLDSTPIILDLVSIVQNATDVAEKIASDDARNHLQAVKKAAKTLAQAVSHK